MTEKPAPDAAPDAPALITNGDLARIFHEIGEMLEVKGELVFKTVAYHRAADALAHSPLDVAGLFAAGTPPRIPGVGEAIAQKIDELVRTGRLAFHERLREEVPPALVEMLQVPGIGPKTVKLLYETLRIESLEDLKRAAEAGTLRSSRGMTERTEASILAGIRHLESRPGRLLLGRAEALVAQLIAQLLPAPGVSSIVPAGSSRPGRSAAGANPSATWTSRTSSSRATTLLSRRSTSRVASRRSS